MRTDPVKYSAGQERLRNGGAVDRDKTPFAGTDRVDLQGDPVGQGQLGPHVGPTDE